MRDEAIDSARFAPPHPWGTRAQPAKDASIPRQTGPEGQPRVFSRQKSSTTSPCVSQKKTEKLFVFSLPLLIRRKRNFLRNIFVQGLHHIIYGVREHSQARMQAYLDRLARRANHKCFPSTVKEINYVPRSYTIRVKRGCIKDNRVAIFHRLLTA